MAETLRRFASPKTPGGRRTGNGGDRTSPSGSGARCARITRPAATPGTTSARSRAKPRLSLGRGRAPGHLRSRVPPLFRARALERARSDPQGAAVRPHRPRGQSRRGREGVLLLSRLDADAFVHEGALQVSAGASSPTQRLVEENRRRGKLDPEFELIDTGIFDDDRYFDVFVEYAKASPDDILIRITVANRGPEPRAAARAADAVVPQHVVLGLRPRGLLAQAACIARRRGTRAASQR